MKIKKQKIKKRLKEKKKNKKKKLNYQKNNSKNLIKMSKNKFKNQLKFKNHKNKILLSKKKTKAKIKKKKKMTMNRLLQGMGEKLIDTHGLKLQMRSLFIFLLIQHSKGKTFKSKFHFKIYTLKFKIKSS